MKDNFAKQERLSEAERRYERLSHEQIYRERLVPKFFTPHHFKTKCYVLGDPTRERAIPEELLNMTVGMQIEPLLRAWQLVMQSEVEVSFNFFMHLHQSYDLSAYNILVPYQIGRPTTVDVSAAMKGQAFEEEIYLAGYSQKEITQMINDLKCHAHSHVWGSTIPSSVDDSFIEEIVTKDKPLYFMRAIGTKRGRLEFALYLVQDNIMLYDVPWRYEWPEMDAAEAWAKDQLERKVTVEKNVFDIITEPIDRLLGEDSDEVSGLYDAGEAAYWTQHWIPRL